MSMHSMKLLMQNFERQRALLLASGFTEFYNHENAIRKQVCSLSDEIQEVTPNSFIIVTERRMLLEKVPIFLMKNEELCALNHDDFSNTDARITTPFHIATRINNGNVFVKKLGVIKGSHSCYPPLTIEETALLLLYELEEKQCKGICAFGSSLKNARSGCFPAMQKKDDQIIIRMLSHIPPGKFLFPSCTKRLPIGIC